MSEEFSAAQEMWMGEALELADRAAAHGEAPIGALVILEDRVIGRGMNRRELDDDPSAHAEVIALREAARRVARWRLDGAWMVVTLEPCLMCAGALLQARVAGVLFGTTDSKGGALTSLYQVGADPRLNHRFEVRGGCRAQEAAQQLRAFFAGLRDGSGATRPTSAKSLRGF